MALKERLLKYIENLQATTRLNWAECVYSMIFENIEACLPQQGPHKRTDRLKLWGVPSMVVLQFSM